MTCNQQLIDNFKKGDETNGLLLVLDDKIDKNTTYEYLEVNKAGLKTYTKNITNVAKGFQPFVLDLLGLYMNGIIFMDKNNTRLYHLLNSTDEKPRPLKQYLNKGDPAMVEMFNKLPIAIPHSMAFVDFNGDCFPDLLITSFDSTSSKMYFEFWVGIKGGITQYELKHWVEITVSSPAAISQIAIDDFSNSIKRIMQ